MKITKGILIFSLSLIPLIGVADQIDDKINIILNSDTPLQVNKENLKKTIEKKYTSSGFAIIELRILNDDIHHFRDENWLAKPAVSCIIKQLQELKKINWSQYNSNTKDSPTSFYLNFRFSKIYKANNIDMMFYKRAFDDASPKFPDSYTIQGGIHITLDEFNECRFNDTKQIMTAIKNAVTFRQLELGKEEKKKYEEEIIEKSNNILELLGKQSSLFSNEQKNASSNTEVPSASCSDPAIVCNKQYASKAVPTKDAFSTAIDQVTGATVL